jgi:alpha-ketoglutarate-dependent taurine dioxygenase
MEPSPFDIRPLDASFGAVVTGLKLAALNEAAFDELYRTWLDYALLIFPGQHLTRDEQIAFARRFGAPEFEIAPISNVRPDGSVRPEDNTDAVIKVLKGNMGWHCDSTYMPVQAKGAVFTCHVAPDEGGETGWADMRAAYDALDDSTRGRIASLSAHHSLLYSQGKIGLGDYTGYGMDQTDAPLRPLVKVHPETGRKCLMVGRHAYGIPGLAPDESERLLQRLGDFAVQPPRAYHHKWTPGDAVVWDNRALMHRACPWDMTKPRVMYHSRIAGDPASEGWKAAA